MIRSLKVPKLSTNVEEVTITKWLKKVGDVVAKGEALTELTTDKAAFEFEAPCAGVLRKIIADKKSTVPTGYIIGLMGSANDPLPDVESHNSRLLAANRKPQALKASAHAAPDKPAKPTDSAAVRATPAARRLARENNIDLAEIGKANKAEIVTEEMVKAFVAKGK